MSSRRRFGPLRRVRTATWADQPPTWQQARPGLIRAALHRAQARPAGGWYVLAASRDVRPGRAFGRVVGGRELVAWRGADGTLHVGPGACPHLGAALADAPVHEGRLVCRWHGLALGPDGRAGWRPFAAHDDGVLAWVRLPAAGEPATDAPPAGPRPDPARSLVAVATAVGRCEPADVLANRLDPWHGSWLHPYSFTALTVLDTPTAQRDRFLVEVTFTVGRRLGVPVRAEFSCPGPRTVTMRIVEGEFTGSVVETHATPLRPGPDGGARTAVIEAVLGFSDRPGFALARAADAALRPVLAGASRRLWRDDLDYAERRYALRAGAAASPGPAAPEAATGAAPGAATGAAPEAATGAAPEPAAGPRSATGPGPAAGPRSAAGPGPAAVAERTVSSMASPSTPPASTPAGPSRSPSNSAASTVPVSGSSSASTDPAPADVARSPRK